MLVNFLNSFMSYLLLVIIIVIVAGIAIFIGMNLAKSKNCRNAKRGTENITKDNESNV